MKFWSGRCSDGEEERGEETHCLVYVFLRFPLFCAKALPVWHQADLYQHRAKIQQLNLAIHSILSQSVKY